MRRPDALQRQHLPVRVGEGKRRQQAGRMRTHHVEPLHGRMKRVGLRRRAAEAEFARDCRRQ